MDSWIRIAIFALILLSFLRRIAKAKAQGRMQAPAPRGNVTPTLARPRAGKKDDFRDVPPPPENPWSG